MELKTIVWQPKKIMGTNRFRSKNGKRMVLYYSGSLSIHKQGPGSSLVLDLSKKITHLFPSLISYQLITTLSNTSQKLNKDDWWGQL